ncbi:membrane protein, partial [Streptomyces sp. NRRL WC-3753]
MLIFLGALVPVVPTGAIVSGAAVVAFHEAAPVTLLLLFLVSALAAFLGDLVLYWLGQRGVRSRGGSRWLDTLRQRAAPDRLEQARAKLDDHGVAVL